jgi:hypothetical protein
VDPLFARIKAEHDLAERYQVPPIVLGISNE